MVLDVFGIACRLSRFRRKRLLHAKNAEKGAILPLKWNGNSPSVTVHHGGYSIALSLPVPIRLTKSASNGFRVERTGGTS